MTLLEVYTMALGAARARAKLSSTSENSREAEVCNTHYGQVRRMVFRAAYWPSLRAMKVLTLKAERDFSADWVDGDPKPPYKYAYRLPNSTVAPRYLTDYSRFELMPIDGIQCLHTNMEDAVLVYSYDEANPDLWDVELLELVVAMLAMKIAGPLGADNKTLGWVTDNAQTIAAQTTALSANVDHLPVQETIPDWIQARDYAPDYTTMENYYYYPTAPLYFPNVNSYMFR